MIWPLPCTFSTVFKRPREIQHQLPFPPLYQFLEDLRKVYPEPILIDQRPEV